MNEEEILDYEKKEPPKNFKLALKNALAGYSLGLLLYTVGMTLYFLNEDFLEGIIPFIKVGGLVYWILVPVWGYLFLYWKPFHFSFSSYWDKRADEWHQQFLSFLKNKTSLGESRLIVLIASVFWYLLFLSSAVVILLPMIGGSLWLVLVIVEYIKQGF